MTDGTLENTNLPSPSDADATGAPPVDTENLGYPDGINDNAPLHAQIAELNAQVVELSDENRTLMANSQELQQNLAESVAERDRLRAELAEKAKGPPVTRGAKPAKPRKLGPIDDKDRVSGDDLLTALREAPHSVAFSDGKAEIAVLEPLIVQGDAWTDSPAGILLDKRVDIAPDRAITIAGFALIDPDGKQIGWSPLAQPIPVAPGTQLRLDRQIIF